MIKLALILFLCMFSFLCKAQYSSTHVDYVITKIGDESILKGAGLIEIDYDYDSIGKTFGIYNENEYLRFRYFSCYMEHNAIGCEQQLSSYFAYRASMLSGFHSSMNEYCKDKQFEFSPAAKNTKYLLKIYFYELNEDVQKTERTASMYFIERATNKVILRYDIKEKHDPTNQFNEFAVPMGRYFRKHI